MYTLMRSTAASIFDVPDVPCFSSKYHPNVDRPALAIMSMTQAMHVQCEGSIAYAALPTKATARGVRASHRSGGGSDDLDGGDGASDVADYGSSYRGVDVSLERGTGIGGHRFQQVGRLVGDPVERGAGDVGRASSPG